MPQPNHPRHASVPQALRRMRNASKIHRLTIGVLPDVMKRQLATARAYRRELEQMVLDAKGEVSLIDAHYIDEAANAEVHGSICRWLLRQRWEKMSVQDVLTCSKELLKSKSVRNTAVERLQLDRQQPNLIDALYSVGPDHDDDDATQPDSTPVASDHQSATDGPSDPDNPARATQGIADRSPEPQA